MRERIATAKAASTRPHPPGTNRMLWSVLCTAWLAITSPALAEASSAGSTTQASITIIIDDMGNNLHLGERALRLPGPVTFAVLPHSTHGKHLARLGHQRNKEIMLHMPMGHTHEERPLGPGALTRYLSRPVFEQRLRAALDDIPYVQGINNHMGSGLTQNNERMNWLMATLNQRRDQQPLYFVDSRTSADTVAEQAAHQAGIPNLRRDVFLDHEQNLVAIDREFKRLLALAQSRGYATAIGHPHSITLAYLETVLPKLDSMGVRLVSASGLMLVKEGRSVREHLPVQRLTRSTLGNEDGSRSCARRETARDIRFVCRAVERIQTAARPPEQSDYPG